MAKGYRFTAARRAAFRKMLAARRNTGRRRYRRNTTKAQHRAARRAGARMAGHLTKHQRRVRAGKKAARTRARNAAAKVAHRRPRKSRKSRRKARRTGVGRVRRAIRRARRAARVYRRRLRRKGKRYFRRKYLQRGRGMVRLNRRRRSRRARRNPSRRRRAIRSRRRSYRRNPSRRRRSIIWRRVKGGFYRKNPAQFLKQGAWTLGGLAASRALPLLVANFAPNAAASIVGAAGAWSGVVLSGLSLGALHFATKKFFTTRRGDIMVGATLGLLWEVAMRVLPGGVLGALGLAPASVPAPGVSEYQYGVSEYVSDSDALSGAYVEEGVGIDVQEAMGSCPGCTGNADVRAALGPFHSSKAIVSGGSGHAGILGGSIFAQ